MDSVSSDRNLKKEPKRNVSYRNAKKMKNTFDGLMSGLDMAKKIILELEDKSTETKVKSKEKQDWTKTEQNRTEYPRTLGQL